MSGSSCAPQRKSALRHRTLVTLSTSTIIVALSVACGRETSDEDQPTNTPAVGGTSVGAGGAQATGGTIGSGGTSAVAGAGGTVSPPTCPGNMTSAYQQVAAAVPGTVQAEDFDPQGYFDATPGNEGGAYRSDVDVDVKALGDGYAVGWMTSGEWLEYTIDVALAGDYSFTLLGGAVDAGRTLELSQCGVALALPIDVPQVAAWGEVATSTPSSVHLEAGLQVIRLTVGANDYVDLDSLSFEPAGAGTGGTGGTGGSSSGGADGSGGAQNPDVLGATPPMGWNSWNTFQCNISEKLIKETADAMVSSGMKDAGYEYVVIDDCWMDGRDQNGALRWNATKFPAGIPALAEYVQSKGLKFGIYESANTATCLGLYGGVDKKVAVGSLGHEEQDAATFASWGVDFLKYDLCAGQRSSIVKMGAAIRAQSRPILYSINPGNGENDLDPPKANWDMDGVANMWRIGFDINASWGAVTRLIDQNANLYSYAGPGAYNDPDMLEVGKLANADEDRAHFALWAIMAAPLIAGNDLRNMSAATKAILTNQEIAAVDQDPLGIQGRLVASPGANLQIWSKTLSGTDARAVVLFNRGGGPASITVKWSDIGLPNGSATVRDLYAHADLGSFASSYTATNVPAHGVAMLRITSAP